MAVKKSVVRPTALVRAAHHAPSVALNAPQKKMLDEALRRGEDLRAELEAKTLEYGRWVLEQVFSNDTRAAMDDKSRNTVWLELVRRAGGPTLGISRHLLYVALRIAANDRRITAVAWRNLDVGRKELLLPLRDDKELLKAARHVSDLNLSQPKTREYVTSLLSSQGKSRQVRLTPSALMRRVQRLRKNLGNQAMVRRVRAMAGNIDTEQRAELTNELQELRAFLLDMVKAVKSQTA